MHLGSLNSRGRPSCRRGRGTSGRIHWTVTILLYALYLLSLISLNWGFRRRSPGPRLLGPVVISSTSVFSIIMHVCAMVCAQALGQRQNCVVVFVWCFGAYFCTSTEQGRLNVSMEDICGEQTILGEGGIYRLSMKIRRSTKLVRIPHGLRWHWFSFPVWHRNVLCNLVG